MKYVDCILPLGLEGLFTYILPPSLEAVVQPFMRVIVPLGKSKTYTALAVDIKDTPPSHIKPEELKSVIEVLDSSPVLLSYQYRIWQWIADYYLCPIGDVYRTAFPAGMKQEDGYKPKTETYIRLKPEFRNEQSLHIALNMLKRATKQLDVLNTYLFLSHYDSLEGDTPQIEPIEITREELTNSAKCQSHHVKALIDRGIMETYEVVIGRLNTTGKPHPENIKPLTEAQQEAYEEITGQGRHTAFANDRRPVLLQGVTGSGKTEIYIRMIQDAIDRGEQVLYLLPEIALTVQIMQRLHRVFGDRLGIFHSRYSDAERVEIWQKQLSDSPYDVILGARSAVYLPFTRLGLIIIDEEHESSFKQQDPAPRYHARSVAMVMANMMKPADVRIVLGTATPSLESYFNTTSLQGSTSKYRLVRLEQRFKGMQLPQIDVVNTADLQRRKMMLGMFSPTLLTAVKEALENDQQVILFQNRRGFAPQVECHQCGWIPRCENCDVSLTMHKTTNTLTCHYCGYTYRIPRECPACECTDIRVRGYGTEKIEEELELILHDKECMYSLAGGKKASIARMDLDTTRTKNAYERIISDFSAGKTNVLIGTQMVSKGLDFDKVSVVGIINADTMLNYPDFRAYEHAFQMLSQVSGRAGRKGKQGRVILQTKHPELPVISQVVNNDYRTFFNEQCDERRMFNYPPYTRIVYVYLRHVKDPIVDSAAIETASRLRQLFGTRVLGPDRPSVARVKTLNIRKIVLKLELGIDLPRVRLYLRRVREEILKDKHYASLQIFYDVDPL